MVFFEFLPNPVGKDADGEWIELLNNGQETVNLFGWQIKDASGKVFVFKNKTIGPGEPLRLDYKTTKISLNNNGESLFLYDANGNLVDKTDYGGAAEEGKIFSRQDAKELPASLIANPILNNQSVGAINAASKLDFSNSFVGFFLAVILSFVFVFVIKKLNLLSE